MPNRHDFFVGYRPTPRHLRRFLQGVAFAAVFAASALAALRSLAQREPGPGRWDADQVITVEGVLRDAPYPVIEAESPLILVGQGKRGAAERLKALEGHRVRARGYRLERDGLRLLELAEEDDAVEVLGSATVARREPATGSPVTLRGELIDPKCFCGAMKPGDGKTHKACAALCLRGGIPPVLVTRDRAGAARYHLLADAAGGCLLGGDLARVVRFAGDFVEVSGVAEVGCELPTLRADVSSLRRL